MCWVNGRGQGESDKPEGGYDKPTLIEDIRVFLESKKVKRVTLIGYSLADNEMTEHSTEASSASDVFGFNPPFGAQH